MKRAISMLVAVVMIISMIPNVFAASETAIVVEDISEIAVELNADNGYYAEYSWTPSDDGEMSLYQYTELPIEVMLTQGDNFATSYSEDEDGNSYYGWGASLNVVAGEEVIIEVVNSEESDQSFTMYGYFYGAPGKSMDNPIYIEELESTVTNAGTLWYSGFFGGADVTVTGTGDFSVILNEETIAAVDGVVSFAGVGRNVIFAIVGDGEFTVKAIYPMGSQMNPEILFRPAGIYVNLAEGNDQGYYYKWTAMDGGQLVLTCPTIEGVSYDVTLYNLNSWAMASLQESEDNTVAVNVASGDEVQIHIVALPDENMAYPAVNTTLTGELLQNIGTRENPEVIFSAEEIVLDIPEGRSQGYYYKWTTFANGELTLTCPTVEGVEYNVILTNMTTYAQAWMSDSTDGTVTIAVSSGDAVVIEIGIYPDADWNVPALATTLTGTFTYPVGSYDNPEAIFRPAYIPVNIAEGAAEYYYKWTANADGELKLTCPTVEGVGYNVILTNQNTYAMAWLSDSADGTVAVAVSAGDEVLVNVVVDPDMNWNFPALSTALTGEFIYPVGTQMNPEVIFRPNYIPVNIEAGNNQGYFLKWTANADGELKLTCPAVEGVAYDVNMTNMTTYAQAWLIDSTDGTITLAVSAGDEVIIQVAAMPDASWNIPALSTALTGEFIYPVGTQMNPEVIFRPAYIPVSIEAGNNQGYFYKWTANADGELKLTCPAVEGVEYDVNMTNMSTYAQAWLIDSTDGTITLAVKAGDEVIIQVAAIPDASWNIPALSTALTGEFIYPIGTQMNPEVIFRPAYIPVNIEAGNNQGYFYKWTANADGELKLTCPAVEGVEYDVNMTNMSTYAQAWLIDSTDGTITLAVSAGDEVIIQVAALPGADWSIPALSTALTGEFIYPIGTQMNPEIIFRPAYIPVNIEAGNNQGYFYKWTANADGALKLTCPAGEVAYDVNMTNMSTYAQAWLIDSTDGTITLAVKAGDEVIIQVAALPDASWNIPALSTALTGEFIYPVGTQMNPEVLTSVDEINVSIAAGNNQGYFYKWTANADGELKLVCPAVEGVEYDVNMTNMSTYAQAWLIDSTDGTITLAVKAGDEVIIQVAALPDASWNIPALNVTLTNGKTAAAIVAQPEDVTAKSGTTATFTVAAEGEVVSYKWQYKKLHVWFDTTMTGYNTDTLTVAVNGARNNYQYRCVITYADGTEIISNAATLTVPSTIVITSNPNDQVTAPGSKGQFTAYAEGDGIKYAWQYSRNGETWAYTQMEGYTKPTVLIEATAARDGYLYRCEIKDATGAVAYTEPATLTVLQYTTQPADVRTSAGENVTFSVVTNVTEGVTYQWQYSRNGETWANTSATGYNTATLTVAASNARDGYQYRCVITGAKNSQLISKAATLNVGSTAVITAQPESVAVAAGANAVFSVAASNAYSYQWQYSRNGGQSWLNTSLTGADTESLTVGAIASRNGYQYRCMITGTDGEVVYTNAATLTVG